MTAVQVNILESDDWRKAKRVIATALAPFPDAGAAVADALESSGL